MLWLKAVVGAKVEAQGAAKAVELEREEGEDLQVIPVQAATGLPQRAGHRAVIAEMPRQRAANRILFAVQVARMRCFLKARTP